MLKECVHALQKKTTLKILHERKKKVKINLKDETINKESNKCTQ